MSEKLNAENLFEDLLKRPDIDKAYAMVKPTDSWYETIMKVHNALHEIQQLPHEVMQLTSHDQLQLTGIYYPGNPDSHVTVICIHGYTSHAEREWAFPGLFYLSLGYNVLIPYQRAHGPSEGKYISFGALEQTDMQGWVKKINQRNPQDRIIIHGLSMGGGIALTLVDKPMKNVKGIISDAPCISPKKLLQNIAKDKFTQNADIVASYVIDRFEKEFGADINDLEAMDHVANSKYPLLLSAGSKENMDGDFETLQKVHPHPTDIIILPGCDHGNGMYKQTKLYQTAIREFLDSVL